jgi:hypothetical protein
MARRRCAYVYVSYTRWRLTRPRAATARERVDAPLRRVRALPPACTRTAGVRRGPPLLHRVRVHRPPCAPPAFSLPSAPCSRGAVAQKKDIKRQKQRLDALKREHADEQARAKAAARERVLAEFERGQLGLAGPSLALSTNGKPEDG